MLKRLVPTALFMLILAGCASAPVRTAPVHGIVMETLQGGVNISLASPAGKIGGNGVLFYQRPESFRLSILSPFGQIMLDTIINGDKVTCLMADRKKVWQGEMRDLPDSLGVRVWPLMKWVVEPPHPAGPALERVFTRPDGTIEKVSYDSSGFVHSKVNENGDKVVYGDYQISEDVAVPTLIDLHTADGSRLQLRLEEPEVNRPIDREIFEPKLEGYEILPLSEFREF
jgi:outer membrane lipoprotein LolB